MKTLLLALSLLFIVSTFAQDQTWTNEAVEEAAVPEAVKNTFNGKYNPSKVVRWERRTWAGKDKTHVKYVVVFDQDGLRHRARYWEDGKGISATTYYWLKNVAKLPAPIKQFAADNYPDFKLASGEKELNLKKGTYVYRIRMNKNKTKVVVYLNENGEEVSKDNIDKEILENENESNN